MIGQHAMAGTLTGNQNHTQNSRAIDYYRLNGRPIGETAQIALFFGALGLPLIFLSGDADACREAKALVPGIGTVAVKEGVAAARRSAPGQARQLIREGSPGGRTQASLPSRRWFGRARTCLKSVSSTPMSPMPRRTAGRGAGRQPDGAPARREYRRSHLSLKEKRFGQHAMAGTLTGNQNHTQNSRAIDYYRLNGRPIGETAQIALYFGALGLPLILLSGDAGNVLVRPRCSRRASARQPSRRGWAAGVAISLSAVAARQIIRG